MLPVSSCAALLPLAVPALLILSGQLAPTKSICRQACVCTNTPFLFPLDAVTEVALLLAEEASGSCLCNTHVKLSSRRLLLWAPLFGRMNTDEISWVFRQFNPGSSETNGEFEVFSDVSPEEKNRHLTLFLQRSQKCLKLCSDLKSLQSKVRNLNLNSNMSHQCIRRSNNLSCYPLYAIFSNFIGNKVNTLMKQSVVSI